MVSQRSRLTTLRWFSLAFSIALVLLALGLTAVRSVHAAGQTFMVTTTMDGHQGAGATCASSAAGGACTLRAAIDLADKGSGDTVVVDAPSGELTLEVKPREATQELALAEVEADG